MPERTNVLRDDIEDTRDHMTDTIDAIGDRVIPSRVVGRRREQAAESVRRVRERVMGVAHRGADTAPSFGDARSSVSGTASSVGSTVGDAASSVTETVKGLPDAVGQGTQGSPLVAGGLAFGVGFLVASLLPATETEQAVAPAVMEPLKEQATEIGKEVASAAKEKAQQAAEQTKQVASEGAAQVKEQASTAADEVKGTASSAADEVKGTAKS
jgi:hypothetical protein